MFHFLQTLSDYTTIDYVFVECTLVRTASQLYVQLNV